jgi:general stress protein 26
MLGPKLLLTLAPLALAAFTLSTAKQRADEASVLEAAREIMVSSRYCALITLDEQGPPQARAMDPFPPSEQFEVWLATHAKTRKVRQVERDARVTLYYFDPKAPAYVTLMGRAELVRDSAEKSRRWKEDWAPFYSDKNRGDDYVLIKVTPHQLEIVSYPHGIASEPKAWRPVIVRFKKEENQ